MQTRHLLLLASLLAAPIAMGHIPDGTPKDYCEPWWEWEVHDYAPPADGRYLAPPADGNQFNDCDGDGVPGDYDGHKEWAMGGAWLSASSAPGYSMYGQYGGGSAYCLGEDAHHPTFPTVSAFDITFGAGVFFRVSADHWDILGLTWPSCGDFESETYIDCIGSCTVPFPPGLDGAYHVCVEGTQGHVVTGGGWSGGPAGAPPLVLGTGTFCGSPTQEIFDLIPDVDYPQCMDGWDNDNDGSVDWINDAECNSPIDDTEQS